MTLPGCSLRKSLSLAGPLLLLALPLGCGKINPPAEEKLPPAPVKWENARRFNLSEWTELVGMTQPLPDRRALITAPVEGIVLTVLQGANGKPVVEGQPVRKGDVIVQLNDTILRSTRDREAAHHKITKEEIEQARSAVKIATLDVERLKDLKAKETKTTTLVPAVELKKAEVLLEEAQSKLRAAQLKLEADEQGLAALNEQLRLYTLTAPIDGRLGRLQVVPGQTLAIGTLVTDVLDVSARIDVLCYVPAQVARQLQLSQKAQIGGLDKDFAGGASGTEGEVVFIAEQADPDTGNFAVKVRFPNKEARLPVNAVLQIRVQTKPEKECFSIPETALMEDQDPPTVVVAEEKLDDKGQPVKDDKGEPIMVARRVAVKVGIRDRALHQVEILGFEDPKWHGDVETVLFVTEKGQGLQTGDEVKLQVDEDE
jgi:RND family efflux transporter MFP subunit